jgi:hypothetical protein
LIPSYESRVLRVVEGGVRGQRALINAGSGGGRVPLVLGYHEVEKDAMLIVLTVLRTPRQFSKDE